MTARPKKESGQMTPQELAERLETLAAEIRAGSVTAAGNNWTVPEAIAAKFQIKEKKGRLETKIRMRWSTLDDYTPKAREKIDRWQDSMAAIKKQMTAAWKRIDRSAKAGTTPEKEAVAALLETSRAFERFAESDWKEPMRTFIDHIENLERAITDDQPSVVQHEIRDLRNGMKVCHKMYK